MTDPRAAAQALASAARDRGEPLGWFERLYAGSGGNPDRVPWADLVPNPHLVAWAERVGLKGRGRPGLVVGCGLGDDAEWLARRGFAVTAFDIAPTAIAWCRRRFPDSPVGYQVADLLRPPVSWHGAFEVVVEVYTLQSLPTEVRPQALRSLGALVAPGGRLFLLARGRDETDDEGCMPWPLTHAELAAMPLASQSFEDFLDQTEHPPVRRFRAVWTADPAAATRDRAHSKGTPR
ncbi:MAG: class I SAM-dependent methyltransferase [Egibacteraceae bacterium]